VKPGVMSFALLSALVNPSARRLRLRSPVILCARSPMTALVCGLLPAAS
jgi:hypothetical protein